MCGLAGIFAYDFKAPAVNTSELIRIRDQMQARGPDGHGLWVDEKKRIGLAHRRLAIIDLTSEGAQPMSTSDGRYQIVFNGEIYNHIKLRNQLIEKGYIFKSQSDTEVLLNLYREYREKMCEHLRGMFAFVIWDGVQRELFFARDTFGIKPLYIADDGKTLRFASQVKALLAGGAIDPKIDFIGDRSFWVWGHVEEPNTLFEDIKSLNPGSWCLLREGGFFTVGMFDSVSKIISGENTLNKYQNLREAVLDSVSHHLVADVPVGLFLSSGIDSATLVALAKECASELQTVTLGFEEYRGTSQDEVPMAEEIAKLYGTKHHTIWIGRSEFSEAYNSFIQAMDQPTIDGLNTWLVSRAAKQIGLKVAISGLGGDEIFCGYPSFRQIPRLVSLSRPISWIPGLGRMVRMMTSPIFKQYGSPKMASLLEYGGDWEGAYLLRRAVRMPWEIKDEFKINALTSSELKNIKNKNAKVSYLESTRYMRNQLLRDSDWASMDNSLELRVPFVDVALTRYVASQRIERNELGKLDLASTAIPNLPPRVIMRPKTGFTVPVREWMSEKLSEIDGRNEKKRGLRGWQETVRSRVGK